MRLGIIYALTSRYYPAGNGQIEQINLPVEAYLQAYINANQDNWEDWLQTAEFAYNNILYSAIGITPIYASNGRQQNIDITLEAPGAILNQIIAIAYIN